MQHKNLTTVISSWHLGNRSCMVHFYIHYKPQNTLLWLLQRDHCILNKFKSEDKGISFLLTYLTFLVLLVCLEPGFTWYHLPSVCTTSFNSFWSSSVKDKFFQLLLVWKCLYLALIFEGYFGWMFNSRLTGFFSILKTLSLWFQFRVISGEKAATSLLFLLDWRADVRESGGGQHRREETQARPTLFLCKH